MNTGLIVVIVLVVLVLAGAAAFLAVQGGRRRDERARVEAAEHRHEAEIRTASAECREAEAAERAARAEREQAQAREQAARARQDREVASAETAAADRVDPDMAEPGRDSREPDPAARTDELDVGDQQGADRAARTDELHLGEREPRPGRAVSPDGGLRDGGPVGRPAAEDVAGRRRQADPQGGPGPEQGRPADGPPQHG